MTRHSAPAAALLLALCPAALQAAAPAPTPFVDGLAVAGKVAIPMADARRLETRLGQLLVINVDGFGYAGDLALAPGYADVVRRLQVGGVIPHYGSSDIAKIRRTNRALAALTGRPLLLCCDIVTLRGRDGTASFGDGYVGGFLGKYRKMPDVELAVLARLNAFAFAAIGVNVALGPTVDTSTGDARVLDRARLVLDELDRYDLSAVIKHFPTLPSDANLHRGSPDTKLPARVMEQRAAVFRALAPRAGLMMSTHLQDSLMYPGIATFSADWVRWLRRTALFGGPLMSDGLLMLAKYTDRSMLGGGPPAGDTAGLDEAGVWALRAILAGHDMVIVEGTAAQTERVFDGLLTLACGGTALGKDLGRRIDEAWTAVTRWKAATPGLRRAVEVPTAAVQDAIALLPGPQADLAAFRFDRAALSRLQPALDAARR